MKKITILLCMSLLFCFTDCKRKPDYSVAPIKSTLTDRMEDEMAYVTYLLDDSIVSLVDRKYKVRVNYPRAFAELDTSTVGTTLFYYPNKQDPEVLLRLFVGEDKKKWNKIATVRSATEAFIEEETASYYLFSGSGWWYHQNFFIEKVFFADGKWIDLTIFYSDMAFSKLSIILDNWTPFDNMKMHRVAKPVIEDLQTKSQVGQRLVFFESDYHYQEWLEVEVQDLQERFRSNSCEKKLLFSKNMGGKKHRDFYMMETGEGVALVVHDNWKGNVRSLVYEKRKKNKECKPREGAYADISGFPSPDGKYFFAVHANYRNGLQSWPYEYDIYRINTTTLEARYITACGSCYKNKNGFTVITGKDNPNLDRENLDRYETYDFSGRMVSKTKYIPEIKLLDNFYKGNDKKEKTNLPSIRRNVGFL